MRQQLTVMLILLQTSPITVDDSKIYPIDSKCKFTPPHTSTDVSRNEASSTTSN